MLTRLKVDGFKNLDGMDVRFGPFTCVAGPNGVGKSNLFDAIAFLAALADKPLVEAALAVRGGEARRGDVRGLFRRLGSASADEMSFVVEMLIPATGEDDLGQRAEASMTFLRYELKLRYRADPIVTSMGTIEVASESMVHINQSAAKAALGFPHDRAWRESVVTGRRTSPYISTERSGERDDDGNDVLVVSLHADSVGGKGGGRPRQVKASSLPRTMLSSASNAAEHRTLVLARHEMRSWTQLQLEPTALRKPDSFTSPRSIGANGGHLAATLYELSQRADARRKLAAVSPEGNAALLPDSSDVFSQVANRLSELVENVRRIRVDVDEKHQTLSIIMTDARGTDHVASALSDGTLRFLALTVMEADTSGRSVICLEEPENGMHPLRIPAVIRLLTDLAVSVEFPVDEDNPLRQVVVNTHSPAVVACVPDDSLLVADTSIATGEGGAVGLTLRGLSGTWRDASDPLARTATRGQLRAYLSPLAGVEDEPTPRARFVRRRRVMDRTDLQFNLFPRAVGEE